MNSYLQAFQKSEINFFDLMSIDKLQNAHFVALATGVDASTLNHAIILNADPSFEENLIHIEAFYNHHNIPWELQISQELQSELDNRLKQAGFIKIDIGVGMMHLLENIIPSTPTTSKILKIKTMQNNLEEWSIPVTLGFESTSERMQPYTHRHQLAEEKSKHIYHFSGFIDNQAVCSLTLTVCDNFARLDDVATIPAWQRRGYASHLINAALEHAKLLQCKACFLEASKVGLGVYQKTGFQTLNTYHYYEPKQP